MSKRKRKKKRKARPALRSQRHRQPTAELQASLRQAEGLIETGRAREAVELLEPLLVSNSRVAELHLFWGHACVKAGDVWTGLAGLERALALTRDPKYWRPLALLYLDLEMNAHALHALRRVPRRRSDLAPINDLHEVVAHLEQDIGNLAQDLRLPVAQVVRGLRHQEVGNRALESGDYAGCVSANRQAIKLLAGWPPPSNNLSLALFFSGQPNEAILVARRVLAENPDNVQSLGNAIRFLAWTGQEDQAQNLWSQLKAIKPRDRSDRLKMAEAAAILHQDEHVHDLLNPLDGDEAMWAAASGHQQ